MKVYKNQPLLTFIVIFLLVVFDRTVPQVTLIDRAIVTVLSVDFLEDKYEVGAQIVKSSSQGNEKSMGYVVAEGKGKTLGEAISDIGARTGLDVSLSHCNTIVLGQGAMLVPDLFDLFYLIKSWQLPEQAVVLGYEGRAAEVLKAHLAADNSVGAYLQKIADYTKVSAPVLSTMIKDFLVDYISGGQVAAISGLSLIPVSSESLDQSGAALDIDYYEIKAEGGFLLKQGGRVINLSKDDVEALNYLTNKVKEGSFVLEGEEKTYYAELVKADKKIKYDLSDGYKVQAEIELTVEIREAAGGKGGPSFTAEEQDYICGLCGQKLGDAVERAVKYFKEQDADAAGFYDGFYRKGGRGIRNTEPSEILRRTEFSVDVKVNLA